MQIMSAANHAAALVLATTMIRLGYVAHKVRANGFVLKNDSGAVLCIGIDL